jgi:hypothetical protein
MRRKVSGIVYLKLITWISFSCEKETSEKEISTPDQPVVTISLVSLTMNIGEQVSLKATISPSTTIHQTIGWRSSSPAVATVSQVGLVTSETPPAFMLYLVFISIIDETPTAFIIQINIIDFLNRGAVPKSNTTQVSLFCLYL